MIIGSKVGVSTINVDGIDVGPSLGGVVAINEGLGVNKAIGKLLLDGMLVGFSILVGAFVGSEVINRDGREDGSPDVGLDEGILVYSLNSVLGSKVRSKDGF